LSADKWRQDYLELLRLLIDSTFTERGWHWTGKLVEKSVSCLTSIYFREMSMLEVERDGEGTSLSQARLTVDVKLNHHYWWGKLYRATEIKPQWRVPSEQDISMALDMLGIADDQLTKLNALVKDRQLGDKVWSNEFCRAISVVDKTLRGSYNLIGEIPALKIGGLQAER
jgi:proteasome activator subunit 4